MNNVIQEYLVVVIDLALNNEAIGYTVGECDRCKKCSDSVSLPSPTSRKLACTGKVRGSFADAKAKSSYRHMSKFGYPVQFSC